MFRLTFLNGRLKGRRMAVQHGPVLIGRDPECQVDLVDDDEVSRRHALIEERADGYLLRDLGSVNPVQVNGRPVKEIKLKHGDRVEIGRTQLLFQLVESHAGSVRRRLGTMQALAALGVILLLLAQTGFMVLFPYIQEDLARDAAAPPPPEDQAAADALALTGGAPRTPDERLRSEVATALEHLRDMTGTHELATAAQPSVEDLALQAAVQDLRQQVSEMNAELAAMPNMSTISPTALMATVDAAITNASVPDISTVAAQIKPTVETALAKASQTAAEEAVQTARPAPVAGPDLSRAGAEAVTNALLVRARDMLAEALVQAERSNFVQADQILERIEIMAPDFVPAYVERARLFEQRGLLKKAGEQWSSVMGRTLGTPLYEQAAAERTRLARAELIDRMTTEDEVNPAVVASRLPQRIRILKFERERFSATRDYEEMRIVRTVMKSRLSDRDLDPSDFAAVVTFYDKGLATGQVYPSRAVVPEDPLRVEGAWRAGAERTVTAAYIVPKGFRDKDAQSAGEKSAYEGFRVQLYYQDQLQDEDAMPKSLLGLPSPASPSEIANRRANEAAPLE